MREKKFETKKSLGQHFLTTPTVPKWMCDAASVTKSDLVLEIGPGTGILTHELLARGATVIALEADSRALVVLEETFSKEITEGQLVLHHTDVRDFELKTIEQLKEHQYKVVANIPYYLSGLLFRMMLESQMQPSLLVYLVQKEVAKRITVSKQRSEKESILSLSITAYGTAKYVKTVSRGHFSPAPNVDSAIILVEHINRNNFKNLKESFFFELLHIGFGQKRKQLLGNLSKYYNRSILTNIFSTLSLPISTRAEDVSLEKWLELGESLQIIPQST